jgi:acetyltransferase
MGKMVRKYNKPIVVHSLFASEKPHALDLLRYYDISVYDSLDVACKCIGSLAEYGRYLKAYHTKMSFDLNPNQKVCPEGRALIEAVRRDGRRALLEPEAKRLLEIHGAPASRDRIATTADEAVRLARDIGDRVVLKIVSPDILHKSDAGGVLVGLKTEKQVRQGFAAILKNARRYNPKADIRGVLVAPMAPSGVEVIIGTQIDDQFGPTIMYGLGGILVEVLKDVVFRVLPISRSGAKRMIEETQSSKILDGLRGNPPCDKKALVNLLLLCSDLVEAYPDIEEMDLNPVIVHEQGLSVVDARIILKEAAAPAADKK